MAENIQKECPFVNYRTDDVGYCSYYRRVCRLEESEHDCSVIPLLKIGIADIITDVFHNTYSGPRGDDDPSMDFKQAARQIIRYYLEEVRLSSSVVEPAKAEGKPMSRDEIFSHLSFEGWRKWAVGDVQAWNTACDLAINGLLSCQSLSQKDWSRLAGGQMSTAELWRKSQKDRRSPACLDEDDWRKPR
jgi:hypothetical protein